MGTLRIISYSSQPFANRTEAGELLAQELLDLRGQNPLVLGIPRGGIVVARQLAAALGGDLDIIISRKLRTPGHQELAMGAVSEDGQLFLNDHVVREMGISRNAIEQEMQVQLQEIARRSSVIRSVLPKVPLQDRVVIITDDGVATGATTEAAIRTAQLAKPKRLIAAMPVGARDTLERLASHVDELLCLRAPPYFAAVGQFYFRFDQLEDEDVVSIIRDWVARHKSQSGS